MGMEVADGEESFRKQEPHNDHDRYAVAVKRSEVSTFLVSFGRFA